MITRFLTGITANDIYDHKEEQMRKSLLDVIDHVRENANIYDDPELSQSVEAAASALDDLEWIEANEKAADADTSEG